MDITLTLKEIWFIIMGVGAIVLIAYCVSFMKNLVMTVRHANKILEDAQVISKITADKSKEVDKLLDDIVYSVGSVSDIIKGNQSSIAALTSIVNAAASLKNIIKKDK